MTSRVTICNENDISDESSMSCDDHSDNDDSSFSGGADDEDHAADDDMDVTSKAHGLADVMSKILKRDPQKSRIILAKGKTEKELSNKRKASQVQNFGVKKDEIDNNQINRSAEEQHGGKTQKKNEDTARIKPHVLDRDKEKNLQKIATRGVVQLFMAVQKHHKSVKDKLSVTGSSERRKEQVLKSMTKGQFLDVLKGTASAVKTIDDQRELSSTHDQGTRAAFLRNDFLTGDSEAGWSKDSNNATSRENIS